MSVLYVLYAFIIVIASVELILSVLVVAAIAAMSRMDEASKEVLKSKMEGEWSEKFDPQKMLQFLVKFITVTAAVAGILCVIGDEYRLAISVVAMALFVNGVFYMKRDKLKIN